MPDQKVSVDPVASTLTGATVPIVQGGANKGAPINLFSINGRTPTGISYAVVATDVLVAVTDSSAPRTITLPLASSVVAGRWIEIKDEGGLAGTNNITIAKTGTDTIDGVASTLINTNYGKKAFYSDGVSKWFSII